MKFTIYHSGKIKTMAEGEPEAEAMMISGERILAVGSNVEVSSCFAPGPVEKVDLQGKRVIPGLIDSHLHFLDYVLGKNDVDLAGAPSIKSVVSTLEKAAAARPRGSWIRGINFDHSVFREGRMPTRQDLDVIENPVLITRICRHAHVANTKALEAAGLLERDDLPSGFLREETGRPSGIILETGLELLIRAMPDPFEDQALLSKNLDRCLKEFSGYGITSINPTSAEHIGVRESLGIYQELERRNRLPLRVTVHFNELPNLDIRSFFGSPKVRYGGLKLFADGGFSALTAALSFDYMNDPGNRGELNYETEDLYALVEGAHGRGIQVAAHALGDRAIDQMLDVFERAGKIHGPAETNNRLIHCYVVRPDQLPRMRALGLIADIQPVFLADEVDIAEARLPGEFKPYSYAWKTLLDAGIMISGSSDCCAALPDPWLGVDGAVNRVRGLERTPAGGWHPEQKLDIDQAMALFTKNASIAIGAAKEVGSLEPGKLADFVILDDDPWTVDPEELRHVRVRQTFCSGECVFTRE
ncbi:MAG: amidohydrolase [Thermovirgaceae bacterium]